MSLPNASNDRSYTSYQRSPKPGVNAKRKMDGLHVGKNLTQSLQRAYSNFLSKILDNGIHSTYMKSHDNPSVNPSLYILSFKNKGKAQGHGKVLQHINNPKTKETKVGIGKYFGHKGKVYRVLGFTGIHGNVLAEMITINSNMLEVKPVNTLFSRDFVHGNLLSEEDAAKLLIEKYSSDIGNVIGISNFRHNRGRLPDNIFDPEDNGKSRQDWSRPQFGASAFLKRFPESTPSRVVRALKLVPKVDGVTSSSDGISPQGDNPDKIK